VSRGTALAPVELRDVGAGLWLRQTARTDKILGRTPMGRFVSRRHRCAAVTVCITGGEIREPLRASGGWRRESVLGPGTRSAALRIVRASPLYSLTNSFSPFAFSLAENR